MPSHRVLLELSRLYSEPHRHYHNLEHIAWMLNTGRELALSDAQVLAIWFHDAIYNVPGPDNEADSARLARELLSAEDYPEDQIALVERIVLDTKAHLPSIEEAAIVIDLDLAGMGLPWAQFCTNAEKLMREYGTLPPSEVEAGRRAFLESFLERKHIFSTSWGSQWETQARTNIRRFLDFID